MAKDKRRPLNIDQYFDRATPPAADLDFLLGAAPAPPSPPAAGAPATTATTTPVQHLPVPVIAPDSQQLRRLPLPDVLQDLAARGDRAAQAQLASLEELGASMQAHGQIHPVLVYPDRDAADPRVAYRLLHGQRRWSAAQLLGMDALLALVVPVPSPIDRLVRQYEENERRQDFSDMERALGLMTLKETLAAETGADVPWRVVEAQLRLSESRRKDLLRLLRLPDAGQNIALRYGWSEWTLRPLLTALQTGSVRAETSMQILQHLTTRDSVTAPIVAQLVEQVTTPPATVAQSVTVSFQTNPDPLRRVTRFRSYLDRLPDLVRSADPTLRSRLHTEVTDLLAQLTALQEALRDEGYAPDAVDDAGADALS